MIIQLCTPFAPAPGDPGPGANLDWACAIARRIALAGPIVFAPHLIYPRFLDDTVPEERMAGIKAGLAIMEHADEVWFYLPPWRKVLSSGMEGEWRAAQAMGKRCLLIQNDASLAHNIERVKLLAP